jgi:hypothetical protein
MIGRLLQDCPMPRCQFFCLALVVAASGCGTPRAYQFWHPGNIQTQRLRATVHDPYPDPDQGPIVMGGRPRDYAEPLPEAVKNRIYADSFFGR